MNTRLKYRNPWSRPLLAAIGWICVALGVAGAFLPLLPTTPFLLAALILFSKSSPRFHFWLLRWPFLKQFWENHRSGCGVPRRTKITSIAVLWGALALSALLKHAFWYWGLLASVGIAVSLHLLSLKTLTGKNLDQ